ncbi:protein PEP-RELATED DEVELOPMENT ARRESTED 1, chloroplastic [Macadamia integrifolia]|uniref:protein PEP-RELATED DEVELOPMENT ARRESTED 1, chloroplastic n=1 Tax=Macadamia integrifolia TaxID=60698 RepID=UPI001C4E4683|nr:protein PEP-RELATED DEVELOPMENT ARRESTED 1, chloroplastic [Macadamia integrifolia]
MLQTLAISSTCSCFFPTSKLSPTASDLPFLSSDCRAAFLSFSSQQTKKRTSWITFCTSYEVGGGFLDEGFGLTTSTKAKEDEKWDPSYHEALLKGGEQVTSLLEEMAKLLEDMSMDEASEEAAVELVAQGVIGKRVDEMESGFMMALDYMIQLAEKDDDSQRKSLLEVIKETVLSHLTKKCPPHVQVIGLLCRTPQKESRHELLRRVAAGGGVFQSENGTKVHLPGANLNDIANQADDLLETMETRPTVPDRKLLARLVLVREEARNMMGGGILDERNDRGLNTLPEAEVNFLTKLVALRPGKNVQDMIKNVMQGKDEGADISDDGEDDAVRPLSGGIAGRASVTGRRPLPVRPGMFLETVSKVLGGIYSGNVPGITAQHLEWVHQKTLQVLQEMAF